MTYKVGDKVIIKDERTFGMNTDGDMDEYLGTVMTIRSKSYAAYSMEEDDGEWYWTDNMIEGKRGFKVGDVVRVVHNVELKGGNVRKQKYADKVYTVDKVNCTSLYPYSLNGENSFFWKDEEIEMVKEAKDACFLNTKEISDIEDASTYNVGDRVSIRQDIHSTEKDCLDWVPTMNEYMGKAVTITSKSKQGYRILEDGGTWIWKGDAFEKRATVKIEDVIDGWELDFYFGNAVKHILLASKGENLHENIEEAKRILEDISRR